jgi:hypothetical protein
VKGYNYLSQQVASLWGMNAPPSNSLLWLAAAGLGLYLLWGRNE